MWLEVGEARGKDDLKIPGLDHWEERRDSLGKWGGKLSVEFNLGCVKFQVSLSQQGEGTY